MDVISVVTQVSSPDAAAGSLLYSYVTAAVRLQRTSSSIACFAL